MNRGKKEWGNLEGDVLNGRAQRVGIRQAVLSLLVLELSCCWASALSQKEGRNARLTLCGITDWLSRLTILTSSLDRGEIRISIETPASGVPFKWTAQERMLRRCLFVSQLLLIPLRLVNPLLFFLLFYCSLPLLYLTGADHSINNKNEVEIQWKMVGAWKQPIL